MPDWPLIIVPEDTWVTRQFLKHLEMSFEILRFYYNSSKRRLFYPCNIRI
jgi:hypothetical protein